LPANHYDKIEKYTDFDHYKWTKSFTSCQQNEKIQNVMKFPSTTLQ
jgi:hypothetical protein